MKSQLHNDYFRENMFHPTFVQKHEYLNSAHNTLTKTNC